MGQKVEEVKQFLNVSLNEDKPWKSIFDYVEEKSGIPRLYLFLGGAVACALYLIFGYAAQLLCNIIGVIYPAYVSIKAIESSSKADDTKWLTYWVMYAVFSILEFFSIFLYKFIPCYYLLKCAFLLWCAMPMENNGSVIVYHRLIRPYFLKHQSAADEAIDKITGKAKEIVSDVLKKSK